MRRRLILSGLVAVLATAAAACAPYSTPSVTSDSLVLVNSAGRVAGPAPTWCYSTLGHADCYTASEPAADQRLVGAYLSMEDFAPPPSK